MDFLDPKKSRAHQIRLIVGYVLIGVALVLATRVLVYQANGFGLDKEGDVIQNGLVFVSSTPGSADIYINDQRKDTTNTRLTLQAGTYKLRLTRDGYRDWQRAVTVEGAGLERIYYPFLIPKDLSNKELTSYSTKPGMSTESPDRRWLVVKKPGSLADFDMYDIKDAKKAQSLKSSFSVPAGVFTAAASSEGESLKTLEWSNDNIHFVVQHNYDGKIEYVLVSRKDPAQSVNLSQKLAMVAGQVVTLQDKKYDKYFVHNPVLQTLATASLDAPGQVKLLDNVLAYKTYGTDEVLFVSKQGAAAGKVAVKLLHDGKTYTVRTLAEAASYSLQLSRYNDSWFVTAGSSSENKTYIYKDPATVLQRKDKTLIPVAVLKLTSPTYAAISANSQYILGESGTDFAVYDIENDRSHVYHIDKPLDAPQLHADWMDGNRITYVSAGGVVIFDFDGTNVQSLVPATADQPVIFDTGYTAIYSLSPAKAATAATGQYSLNAAWLRTPRDQ